MCQLQKNALYISDEYTAWHCILLKLLFFPYLSIACCIQDEQLYQKLITNNFITYNEKLLAMPVKGSQEYRCKMCGKKFGDSLGDMERHILTEHMQRGDFSTLKTK